MKGALDVHRELLARDVPHEMVRLQRPVVQADDLPGALGPEQAYCVAVRCYVAGTRTVAVVVRAGATPDPAALLDALGVSSVRPATAAEVNAATDFAAGLVSPVCLPPEVVLLADSALPPDQHVHAPAGESGVALGIGMNDLLAATAARVAPLTARPLPSADRSGWDGVVEAGDVIDLRAPGTAEDARDEGAGSYDRRS